MRKGIFTLSVFLLFLLVQQTAFAAEGRIPLTAPYTIQQPGRYILTDNVPANPARHTIQIEANNVDLDLAGFTVSATGTHSGIYAENVSNISVYNGSIEGGGVGVGCHSTTESKFILRSLRIVGSSQTGLSVMGGTAVEAIIEDNIVVSGIGSGGISLSWLRGSRVKNNVIKGFSDAGIILWNSSNTLVDDNRVILAYTSATADGIGIYMSDSCVIRNNIVEQSGEGIHIVQSGGNVIAGNTVSRNISNGVHIDVESAYNTIDSNMIASNRNPGATASAILFDASSYGNYYSNNRTPFNNFVVTDHGTGNQDLGNSWWQTIGNSGLGPTSFLGTRDGQPLIFKTNNAERLRITAEGRVGIGTDSPEAVLDVAGNMRLEGAFRDSLGDPGTVGQVLSSTISGTDWIDQTAISDGDWTVTALGQLYSAVPGNVGIGTSWPQSKLDVAGGAAIGSGYAGNWAAPADGLIVQGSLGISTVAPWAKLDVHYDSNNYALLGSSSTILAYLQHTENGASGSGQSAFYGYRNRLGANPGASYGQGSTNQAILGYNYWGDPYTYAITGHGYLDYARSGAILGADVGGTVWGGLAYYASNGSSYGGYFTSTISGSGLHAVNEGIGLGGYGDLMGGWLKGEQYGLFSSGKRYALFTDGNNYSTGYQAFVVKDNSGQKTIGYSVASPGVEVIFHGKARLEAGQSIVAFPPELSNMLSATAPVSVFLSPVGAGAGGISLSAVTPQGFEVAHPGGGATAMPVEFDWLAIGKRAGFEDVQTPEEILRPDFEASMQQVAHNENNREESGLGMYFEDGGLRFGAPPGSSEPREHVAASGLQPAGRAAAAADAAVGNAADTAVPQNHPVAKPEAVHSESAAPGVASSTTPVVQPAAAVASFPVVRAVTAGDVLVMIPNDGETLQPCAVAADPMVAGIALSDERDGFASVAGAGYAMVKAEATVHPISRGDLLVTSSMPGYAMKAVSPRSGTIIGKAMADLEAGTALIRVLVMLR